MASFNGFFDNVFGGVTNPKGNLGDWQHAARLFVDDSFKHSPKTKFLYHVTFYFTEEAKSVSPALQTFQNQVGLLVRDTDLPQYSANVETKNQYNRKKNIQTNIEYNPITINFHDDNFGLTTLLLEAYFKYYYADSNNPLSSGAYGNRREGDTLYAGAARNRFSHGLDNNTPVNPFFDRIEIAQMSRKAYTKYTLVNPLISDWSHDSVDYYATSSETMTNSITVNYETVLYDRGEVEAGANGDPTGFGREDNYDTVPSPISTLGGGEGGLLGVVGGIGDIVSGEFNPFEAAIAGANVFDTARNLSTEGLIEEGYNIANDALNNIATSDVSGLGDIVIPKSQGLGGAASVIQASESISADFTRSTSELQQAISQEQTNLQRNQIELRQALQQGDPSRVSSLETRIDNNQRSIQNYERQLDNR